RYCASRQRVHIYEVGTTELSERRYCAGRICLTKTRSKRVHRDDAETVKGWLIRGVSGKDREGALQGCVVLGWIRERLAVLFYADQKSLSDTGGVNVLVARAGLAWDTGRSGLSLVIPA